MTIDSNTWAEGDISGDTVYNGLIKFKNSRTGKLISEYFYTNDTLNGIAREFYENGKQAAVYNYRDNKKIGNVVFYDNSGNLIRKEFYYFDLKVGPSETYSNDKINSYYFYAFDGDVLFNLSYDTLKTKPIVDLVKNYFYFHEEFSATLDGTRWSNKSKEFFLYTPRPPKYDFVYSLVKIDSMSRVIQVIQEFNEPSHWATFSINFKEEGNGGYAIKLHLQDPIVGGVTMIKKL